jgi:hypothetical protein
MLRTLLVFALCVVSTPTLAAKIVKYDGVLALPACGEESLQIHARYTLKEPLLEIPKLWALGKTENTWELSFQYGGKKVTWVGSGPPLVLNCFSNRVYVAAVRYSSPLTFSFFESKQGEWRGNPPGQ